MFSGFGFRLGPPSELAGVAALRQGRGRSALYSACAQGGWLRSEVAKMAAAAVRRALRAARPPAVPQRGLAKPAGPPSARQLREADEASPIFQYVGKAAKRKDRVFVWGFSYSGALGVPSFVKPDAGWKKPRRIQATPYRLETEEKVGAGGWAAGAGTRELRLSTAFAVRVPELCPQWLWSPPEVFGTTTATVLCLLL